MRCKAQVCCSARAATAGIRPHRSGRRGLQAFDDGASWRDCTRGGDAQAATLDRPQTARSGDFPTSLSESAANPTAHPLKTLLATSLSDDAYRLPAFRSLPAAADVAATKAVADAARVHAVGAR